MAGGRHSQAFRPAGSLQSRAGTACEQQVGDASLTKCVSCIPPFGCARDAGQGLENVGLLLVVGFPKHDQSQASRIQAGFLTLKAMFCREFLNTAVV